jgi:hypothetical protein
MGLPAHVDWFRVADRPVRTDTVLLRQIVLGFEQAPAREHVGLKVAGKHEWRSQKKCVNKRRASAS